MAKTFKVTVKKDGRIYISNPFCMYTAVIVRDGKRMMRVGVAWCSPHDKFKRKVGYNLVDDRMANNESLLIPVDSDTSKERIADIVENMLSSVSFCG